MNASNELTAVTCSSLKTFKLCRRDYQLRYVMGLKPLEDAEALYLGTVMHGALEMWHGRGIAKLDSDGGCGDKCGCGGKCVVCKCGTIDVSTMKDNLRGSDRASAGDACGCAESGLQCGSIPSGEQVIASIYDYIDTAFAERETDDIGVAVNTIKSWLSVLEATYQIIILRPYYQNAGKRLVKSPKVYFTDTGTLCYLVGLRDPEHAAKGPMGGAIMETAAVNEIYKTLIHRGEMPHMYFWRTSNGAEVDIVIESDGKLIPIEIKSTATPNRSMAKGIETFRKDFGDKAAKGYVVCPCEMMLPLGPDTISFPFRSI